MNRLVKIISTTVDDLQMRIPKFLGWGKSDIQTATQASPHGIDSNPIKDMIAVYADTSEKGDKVIIGYLNRNQIAEVGETRFYSLDTAGELKTYIWLKNDGTMQIGGTAKNMVRFQELETAFNELKDKFNAHVQDYNTHVHPGVTAGGASTLVTTSLSDPSTADIAPAKIEEITTL